MPHTALTVPEPADPAALLPPPVPIAPCTGAGLLDPELAVRVDGLRAPAIRPSQDAPTPTSTAPFKPSRIDPLNREPTVESATAPFKPFRIDPLNRELTAKPSSTAPRP
jgi:hypothetical protein